MGIATSNTTGRSLARLGVIEGVSPNFEPHESIPNGGVLFLMPALLSQGLMTIKETHSINEKYYSLESIILTLAFMILCRIKNPEQLKQCAPGELGKLIGLDRIPEVKCLRNKMQELFSTNSTQTLNQLLAQEWTKTTEESMVLYTDGHMKIYNGQLANPSKKFISRQKLCLPATADFWLHDAQGLPLMVWTGELSEKLQYMIEYHMIPELISSNVIKKNTHPDSQTPICTLVFDREAYEPKFFERLWVEYKIAIITYRKNVKDKWAKENFEQVEVINKHTNNIETMNLCEGEIELNGFKYREIRCLATREHQTSLITTHPTMPKHEVAPTLFNRWQMENYFKYMRADYALDHIIEYGSEEIDEQKTIVNPEYRSIQNKIKTEKEKLNRLKAQLLKNVEFSNEEQLDKFNITISAKLKLTQEIQDKENIIKELAKNKEKIEPKIKLADLPPEKRITKLKTESAYFMSTLKMICYRAETAIANLLKNNYCKFFDEKRMFIKNIISSPINLEPDVINKTLTVTLHSLNTPMANFTLSNLCEELNHTETIFPGTNLKIIYKSIAY